MLTRLYRVLLTLLVALSMMGTGMHAAAASADGQPWAQASLVVAGSEHLAAPGEDAAPLSPLDHVDEFPELQDPLDRDSLIDPPELFDTLRAPGVDGLDHSALRQPHTAAPPWPFIEGLRRPPRAWSLNA